MDNDYAIWNAYKNEYWPAHYLMDAQGQIRHQHFGEGAYQETERMIQSLLKKARNGELTVASDLVQVAGSGATVAAMSDKTGRSPETYLGYTRQQNFSSPELINKDVSYQYSTPTSLKLNQWALSGKWEIGDQSTLLKKSGGAISYRFYGRDLHLVLGSHNGKPIPFKVTIDGITPNGEHGVDIDSHGNGVIKEQRLYQLIRQSGEVREHTFKIDFLDDGAEAFAFTFG